MIAFRIEAGEVHCATSIYVNRHAAAVGCNHWFAVLSPIQHLFNLGESLPPVVRHCGTQRICQNPTQVIFRFGLKTIHERSFHVGTTVLHGERADDSFTDFFSMRNEQVTNKYWVCTCILAKESPFQSRMRGIVHKVINRIDIVASPSYFSDKFGFVCGACVAMRFTFAFPGISASDPFRISFELSL